MLTAKTGFGMAKYVGVNSWPVVGGSEVDVGFECSIVTTEFVVVGFAKCHFAEFFG
jgi:hypothetical protein